MGSTELNENGTAHERVREYSSPYPQFPIGTPFNSTLANFLEIKLRAGATLKSTRIFIFVSDLGL